MAGSHLNNVYISSQVPAPAYTQKGLGKTPWVAILSGLIVGAGLTVAPSVSLPNFHHSSYLDKMAFSMAVFTAAIFWAVVELKRGRGRLAIGTAMLGFIVPELLWFQTGRTFLQAYSTILIRALDHIGK